MPITGALERNLQLVNDTLQALVSSQEDFEMVMRQLPYQVSEACETRRGQAQRFMANFIETRVDDKTLDDQQHSPTFNPSHKLIKSNSIMASWSDISIIYDFFKHYTQSTDINEEERIIVSKGLNMFLKDDFNENAPDHLLSRKL